MAKNILVVLGSTRDGRNGLRVAKLVVKHLQSNGLNPTLIGEAMSSINLFSKHFFFWEIADPLEIDAPLIRQPVHFRPPAEQEKAPEWIKNLHEQIK